jgi:HlyD family secretion protein
MTLGGAGDLNEDSPEPETHVKWNIEDGDDDLTFVVPLLWRVAMFSSRVHGLRLTGLAVLVSLIMTGCGGVPTAPTPTPSATGGSDVVPVVSATGKVVPATWANLSFPTAGVVEQVLVAEGDKVEDGQVLVRLRGSEALEAALTAAQLAEMEAQQALDDLTENADVARAEAQLAVAQARDAYDKADKRYQYQQKGSRATSETINGVEAQLTLAEQAVDDAASAANRLSYLPSDDPQRAAAEADLYNARHARDVVKATLNWYTGAPTDIDQALLEGERAQAEAALAEAERTFEKVKDGPDPDALALAQTTLKNAQARVEGAKAALADLSLVAPFAGTVSTVDVRPNEWANPGAPVVVLGDLDGLRVETTDLNEIDVASVAVGAPVSVTFDALADTVVNGRVLSISPKSGEGSGVNYTVVVALDEIPAKLRWGMTAFADIKVGG